MTSKLVRKLHRRAGYAAVGVVAGLAACSDAALAPVEPDASDQRARAVIACDPANGGISLPAGFCATVFADLTTLPRHIVVRGNALFAATYDAPDGTPGGVVGLRDTDGDGHADQTSSFGSSQGNGIAWHKDWLYFAPHDRVERYVIDPATLTPASGPELVIGGLPTTGDHISKTIVIDRQGMLYLNIGSASNSCQVENRVLHSPGQDPCPELPVRAGVWRFDARVLGQTQANGLHWGIGYRNMVALALATRRQLLYGVQHGRDELHDNWPEHFAPEDQASLPSEELVRIDRGDHNGWPFCFHDPFQNKKVLAPEYGGDGQIVGGCDRAEPPVLALPAHWAPNALHFYQGTLFPARYRGGAFIAFHGSHNIPTPLGQAGYNVVFVPFSGGAPLGGFEVFADGFTGGGTPLPQNAAHRPTGLAEGEDGALYISDDKGGRIWRVVWAGP
ncbi:MAG: PQQ-dependent sugar dehydrogenase [Gemmatimonadota bacterium]|nr:PQQ-dependent sugar dehydrogenase [Gemmatimonadota bacterium]